MLVIDSISKHYGKRRALSKLSATFTEGQCIAVIGPNGSGKTTLIKSILKMIHIDEGSIQFCGKDIRDDHLYRAYIGYMPQIDRYPDQMTIGEVFHLIKEIRKDIGKRDLDEQLLLEYDLAQIWDQKMYTLSGGTRQKVGASLAFLFSPYLLLLDEPMAGLDPISAMRLRKKIKRTVEEGRLTLISSHLLGELDEIYTHVLYLDEGKRSFFLSTGELVQKTGKTLLLDAVPIMIEQSGTL